MGSMTTRYRQSHGTKIAKCRHEGWKKCHSRPGAERTHPMRSVAEENRCYRLISLLFPTINLRQALRAVTRAFFPTSALPNSAVRTTTQKCEVAYLVVIFIGVFCCCAASHRHRPDAPLIGGPLALIAVAIIVWRSGRLQGRNTFIATVNQSIHLARTVEATAAASPAATIATRARVPSHVPTHTRLRVQRIRHRLRVCRDRRHGLPRIYIWVRPYYFLTSRKRSASAWGETEAATTGAGFVRTTPFR